MDDTIRKRKFKEATETIYTGLYHAFTATTPEERANIDVFIETLGELVSEAMGRVVADKDQKVVSQYEVRVVKKGVE